MTEVKQPYIERLQCLACGYELWTVMEHEGRTSMAFTSIDGTKITVFRAVLECPICKAKREFYSAPLDN